MGGFLEEGFSESVFDGSVSVGDDGVGIGNESLDVFEHGLPFSFWDRSLMLFERSWGFGLGGRVEVSNLASLELPTDWPRRVTVYFLNEQCHHGDLLEKIKCLVGNGGIIRARSKDSLPKPDSNSKKYDLLNSLSREILYLLTFLFSRFFSVRRQ